MSHLGLLTIPGRPRTAPAAVFLLALFAAGCRESVPALDPGLTSCIPPGAVLVGGLNLEAIRAAPAYAKIPQAVLALAESLRQARYALFVFDGRDVLSIALGQYRDPPAGATLLAPNLALTGAPGPVRAAVSQHSTGATGSPELVNAAKLVAGARPIWIVVRGGTTLPLAGNAANVNRLLHNTTLATVAVGLRDNLDLELTAHCVTPGAARDVEQSLRAMITLAAAANARQSGLAALLGAIQVRRDDRTVHLGLSAAPEAFDQLLRALE